MNNHCTTTLIRAITMNRTFCLVGITACLFLTSCTQSQTPSRKTTSDNQVELVPFHIPGDEGSDNASSFASRLHQPAGKDGFVVIKNGQFHVGNQRQRFWGVNLCFGANFPGHEQADKIAAHFRKLGINVARFHHMDMQDAPDGIWKTVDGKRELDPDQVDKLDYFLNQLHENGIYANINLHVSRTLRESEGFPEMGNTVWWTGSNKWVMYYDPDVQRELKKFCRDLLGHENPYRKLRRADDPGIAMVEMINENYFSVRGTEILRKLPQKYVDSFAVVWNEWLKKKYPSTAEMKKAWYDNQEPMGEFLVESEPFTDGPGIWRVNATNVTIGQKPNQTGPAEGVKALRLEPSNKTEQNHFMQLNSGVLSVEKGKPYSIKFWAKADKKRSIGIEVSSNVGGEWRSLGIFETFDIGTEWQEVKRIVFAEETLDEGAYMAINFGTDETPWEIAGLSLQQGAEVEPLPADQAIEKSNVGIPDSGWPEAAHLDLKEFMVDTEKKFLVDMRSFLRDEIGVKAPITGSQENYHAPGILPDAVDYVDLHNYWHHPTFPAGKDFNPTEYRTGNEPIESFPTRSNWPSNSLLMRTGWRYFDMPFTLSEWNHSEPSDVNSGAVMMAAVLAGLQDWDGIMFFDYEAGNPDWFGEKFEGFFEFNGQPVKLATLAVAGNIYLRGDLPSLTDRKRGTFTDRVDGRAAFDHLIGVDPKANSKDTVTVSETNSYATPNKSVTWNAKDPDKAHLVLNTKKTQGAWGLIANQEFELPSMKLDVGDVARNYATIVLTSMDDKPIEKSKRMILLASSGAENTDMQWNEERTSVSDQWGTGPTLINPVSATVSFAANSFSGEPKVFALDGKGNQTGEVSVKKTNDGYEFEIGGEYSTIWYNIVIQ